MCIRVSLAASAAAVPCAAIQLSFDCYFRFASCQRLPAAPPSLSLSRYLSQSLSRSVALVALSRPSLHNVANSSKCVTYPLPLAALMYYGSCTPTHTDTPTNIRRQSDSQRDRETWRQRKRYVETKCVNYLQLLFSYKLSLLCARRAKQCE